MKRIDIDIWLITDVLAGCINIAAFNLIGNAEPAKLMEQQYKWSLDYYMILVVCVSWMRYFSYFLSIHLISKMTLTLFRMLIETLSFFVILSCYLILTTTMFATLFRDAVTEDSASYKNLLSTLRDLIDYFTGDYAPKSMANFETSHSVLVIVHVLISNIFLMNYLVAILSTVYEIMIKNGDFYAISYSYVFASKYITALSERNGYEKLIIYPPPLNIFLLPLIIMSPNKKTAKSISNYLGYLFFWIENIFVIGFFLIYLIGIDLIIFVKTYYQILKIDGFTNKLFYTFIWTLLGIFYLLYINLVDTCTMFNILCFERSISFEHEEDEKRKIERHKFYIYRDCVRAIK